jgi:hypothetical protein
MKHPVFMLVLASANLGVCQGTFNQFDCNSYGNYSECRATDNTRITCYNGSYSECKVEHPNGFTTSGAGPGTLLINWLVQRHQQHVADKAVDNASATVLLAVRHSMHLMDLSAFMGLLVPLFPADKKDDAEKMTKTFANQSAEFSGAVSQFVSTWNSADRESYLHSSKKLDKLYDSGLMAACRLRQTSRSLTSQWDAYRSKLTPEMIKALDAVEADETYFTAECTSQRAVRVMAKSH